MNQIDLSPVTEFCHSMSAFPSPSKSPAPAIDHTVGTTGNRAALPSQLVPCISHIERSPLFAFCHNNRTGGPATTAAATPTAACDPPPGKFALSSPASGTCVLRFPTGAAFLLSAPPAGTASAVVERSGPTILSPPTQLTRIAPAR